MGNYEGGNNEYADDQVLLGGLGHDHHDPDHDHKLGYRSMNWSIGIAIRMEVLIPAPLGNYDKSTDQPSDRRTGGAIGKLHII